MGAWSPQGRSDPYGVKWATSVSSQEMDFLEGRGSLPRRQEGGGDREEEQEEGEGGGRWEEEEEEGKGPRGKRLVAIMEQESLLHLRDHEIHLFIVYHSSSSCRTLLLRT